MPRIAEKLEFMKIRAAKVCPQTGTGKSPKPKKLYFHTNFWVNGRRKEIS